MSKQLVAALLMSILSAGVSAAQELEPPPDASPAEVEPAAERPKWERVRFGLKAGATWSTLRGQLEFEDVGAVGFKGDFGFVAGASVEIPISGQLALQPEAYLVRKFSELSLGVDKNVLRQKLSVNYAEFPLLLKWYPGGRAGVQGNVVAGPLVSVQLNANIETRRLGNIELTDAGARIEGTDWGMLVGGGFEFAESFASLTVDLRYAHGFNNVDGTGSGALARWSVLQALVGITF